MMEDWQQNSREIYDFQSVEVEPSTLKQSQTSDTTDPLLIHEIKEENLPINFIKQEEFGSNLVQNEQGNEMIYIKEELIDFSEEIKEEPQSQDNFDFKTEEIELKEQEDNANPFENSLVHPEGNEDDTNKDCGRKDELKCNICEYKAGRKSDLKRHITNVHEKIKSLKCTICEYKKWAKSRSKETHRICS